MPVYLKPTYRFVTTLTSSSETKLDSIVSDENGTIYTTGSFTSSNTYINMPSSVFKIPLDIIPGGLLTKMNKSGNELFTAYLEGTSTCVRTDSLSNSYVTTSNSITRFDDSGSIVWKINANNVNVTDVSINSNICVICGNYGQDVASLNSVQLPESNGSAFVAQLNSEGNIVSVTTLQDEIISISSDSESIYTACTESSGAYLAKYTLDTMSLMWKGNTTPNVRSISSSISSSHVYLTGTNFVSEYTLDGTPGINVHIEGTCMDTATDSNNIFICGSYGPDNSNVYISNECKSILPQVNGGRTGGYLIRLDMSGNVVWQVTVSGNNGNVVINSVTIDTYQNSYITGVYGPGTATLYDMIGSHTTLTDCTCASGFSIKLDPNGIITFIH
jgi:hypothetical protein